MNLPLTHAVHSTFAMDKLSKQVRVSTFFDYDTLEPDHRLVVQEHTGEIRKRLRRSAQDVLVIGQRLADVRSRLKHGQFLAWLKAEFGWSQRTAYNFINVYEVFGDKFATFAKIDIATSVLYQLASSSVPATLRTQVLDSALEGETITNKAFKASVDQYKQRQEIEPEQQSKTSLPTKPEIITVIPKSDAIAELSSEEPSTFKITVTAGWHRLLESQHLLFCGDTASTQFLEAAPQAKLAVAVTTQDWAHDWLVDQVDNAVILREEGFTVATLDQLIRLLSQQGDTVIFPWLPLPEMIMVAHRLGRVIYAGDISPKRCELAVASSGLELHKITSRPATFLAG